ncbi:energy transducer TonB [Sphingomonas sp. LT1P40]|uniref:energy transducer TonB n=1 Tax=Alteristakelama amylovorans TaxID=3096166 RepID=UPI002FC8C942
MRGGIISLVLILPVTALAQASSMRMLGKQWVGRDGNQRTAQIGLQLGQPANADPDRIRRLEINWRDFPYQQGAFPVPVGAEDHSQEVGVTLAVDDAGRPRTCEVTKPSGVAAFDAHACPHLKRYLRFHPALTREGTRTGDTLNIAVRYTAGRIRTYTVGGTVPMPWRPMPKPLKPIDQAAIGFSPQDRLPPDVGGTSGWLRVEADGSVSACTLAAPTQRDSFDLAICERLRAWRFEPALDQWGQAVAADFGFGVSRR